MEKKNKVLIADDNERIHSLITDSLSSDQFDIIHAYDGKETLRLVEEQLPDLIILDIMMPLIDGRDICKKLKSEPVTKNIKIIMLTGKVEQHDRLVGFELGADEYIPKPCSIDYLGRKIKALLE